MTILIGSFTNFEISITLYFDSKTSAFFREEEQGRIHGNLVADGWAGAVMRNIARSFGNISYRCTDLPTDMARSRVACPRLKMQMRMREKVKEKWLKHEDRKTKR